VKTKTFKEKDSDPNPKDYYKWILRLKQDLDINYTDIGMGDPEEYYKLLITSDVITNAIEDGNVDIVRYLINHDKNINIHSVLYTAVEEDQIDIIDLAIERGAYEINRAFIIGIQRGSDIETIEHLIEKGVTEINKGLESAAGYNRLDIVKLLLDKGATNIDGALENAVYGNGDKDMIKLLLEQGAPTTEQTFTKSIGNAMMRGKRWAYNMLVKEWHKRRNK
jgi:hypothetical protein